MFAKVEISGSKAYTQSATLLTTIPGDLNETAPTAEQETNEEREQTLNQLLTEMDGFTPDIGVVFLGATNRADLLDPALMRAGRFDKKIRISRPDTQGRYDVLQVCALFRSPTAASFSPQFIRSPKC